MAVGKPQNIIVKNWNKLTEAEQSLVKASLERKPSWDYTYWRAFARADLENQRRFRDGWKGVPEVATNRGEFYSLVRDAHMGAHKKQCERLEDGWPEAYAAYQRWLSGGLGEYIGHPGFSLP